MKNDAKGFWSLIFGTIVAGVAWMLASKKVIKWITDLIMNRGKDDSTSL